MALVTKMWIRDATGFMRRGLAGLVFPPCCVSCGAELDGQTAAADVLLCLACYERMELFSGPMCVVCGAPLPQSASFGSSDASKPRVPRGCFRCAGHKLWFDETIALGRYEDKLRESILRMKQAEGDSLSLAMGRLFFENRGQRLAELGADVVVPVPSHWWRRLRHRTNSAAVLAEVFSNRLGVPLAERLLRRTRYTVRQSDLTPPERWKNVRRAFSVRAGYHLRRAHVLLADDLLTTGATCSDAARALKEAGAERVTVAVVARAMG
jgi:predicted amidophosphoribosyltransferase